MSPAGLTPGDIALLIFAVAWFLIAMLDRWAERERQKKERNADPDTRETHEMKEMRP